MCYKLLSYTVNKALNVFPLFLKGGGVGEGAMYKLSHNNLWSIEQQVWCWHSAIEIVAIGL